MLSSKNKGFPMILKHVISAAVMLAVFTILTGLLYPLLVTGIGQVAFPGKANGDLIQSDGNILGSRLIGQSFSSPAYFWGRPSATLPVAYNAASSNATNYGPSNPALLDQVKKRVQDLRAADPGNTQPIPVDLVTASASGLDPHISVASAAYQLPRVARVRGLSDKTVQALLERSTEGRMLGFLGEPRVNVLLLNLALDEAQASRKEK
jgi:K+-transporting ATPase ATPase C chain